MPEKGRRPRFYRQIAQQLVGRELLRTEHVHHRNRDYLDNRPENLEVLSAGDHTRLHSKETAAKRKIAKDRGHAQLIQMLYGMNGIDWRLLKYIDLSEIT